ncbi:hypothetical protein [Gilliamella bombi]|uniref:hypothetical protein n=1 Tax=Gilliamella bombi TaxID=1908521 RepID=UPI000A165DAB|nr:hypothetical protein [Gilliamella bombi]
MKRILIISLVSLALFGCGEKKVTEEMLIGKWICHKQGLYNIEKTSTDKRNYEINNIFEKYERQKDGSMTRQAYDLAPEKFSFKRYRKEHHNIDENVEYDETFEYQYVSENEFKYIETFNSRYRHTKKTGELNVYTITCVRQKD